MIDIKPKRKPLKVTTIRFSDLTMEQLTRRAAENKCSVSSVVRDLVHKYLRR
jgi:hypothetical protein